VTYRVIYTSKARRALAEILPEAVATACIEFIGGALADNPHRVGKALRAPLEGLRSARRGSFRVIYRIDEGEVTVLVVTIEHRRDVYRS
jgi:mRNA interferase RelE/StbE